MDIESLVNFSSLFSLTLETFLISEDLDSKDEPKVKQIIKKNCF